MRVRHLVTVAALLLARDSAHAQEVSLMAQMVPLYTRADPTATRAPLDEGYLTQPLFMAHASWRVLRGLTTLNGEGLTLERGELTTGTYGEGYVDRRHPHTYLHELLAGAEAGRRGWGASLFAGKGFVPFGSDDPMARPFEKYPVNHHLAQVLERIVAIVAVRRGPVIVEAGTFNGDEPISPHTGPEWSRFGDSWSTRLTVLPLAGVELSASYADVESPEIRPGRGLDARKSAFVARYNRLTSNSWRYALAEYAHTNERDRTHTVVSLSSVLAEAAYCRAGTVVGARIERTDRPEEERLANPFRTPRPPVDLSSLGVSRWTTLTLTASSPPVTKGVFSARPFVEIARVGVAPGNPPGLFSAELSYGTSKMWMISLGMRLRVGAMHGRMGRYGVADPSDSTYITGTQPHHPESHQMPQPPARPAAAPSHSLFTPSNRCSL